MKRKYRLTRSTEFKRVRRCGKSYAHPLLVFVTSRTEEDSLHIGVTAGKSVGGAVQRNRAKRRIRAAIDHVFCELECGWDVIIVARKPLLDAEFDEIVSAIRTLAHRSGLKVADQHD